MIPPPRITVGILNDAMVLWRSPVKNSVNALGHKDDLRRELCASTFIRMLQTYMERDGSVGNVHREWRYRSRNQSGSRPSNDLLRGTPRCHWQLAPDRPDSIPTGPVLALEASFRDFEHYQTSINR